MPEVIKKVVKTHRCFNCGEHPLYYLDPCETEPICINDDCEECKDDQKFPHVIEHTTNTCGFTYIQRHTSRAKALQLWQEKNNYRRDY